MESLTLLLIAMGFVFTLLALLSPTRRAIFTMLAIIIWFPLAAVVATETTDIRSFWVLFFALGLFMFAWLAILVVEFMTGKSLIGEER